MNPFSPYSKAYAALIGSCATALLGVFAADTTVGKVLTVLSILATTFATFQVKNAPETNARDERGVVDLHFVVGVLVGILLCLFLTAVYGSPSNGR